MNLISLFIVSILTENIVLTKFLGMCPFFGTSNKEKNAIAMGISVSIVVVLSSITTYFVSTYILIPTKTEYLKTIIFILIIAALVQIIEFILKNSEYAKLKDLKNDDIFLVDILLIQHNDNPMSYP